MKCKASWLIALAADRLRAVGSTDVKDDARFGHAQPNTAACKVNHSNHPCLDCGQHFATGKGKQQISKKSTDLVRSPAHAQ